MPEKKRVYQSTTLSGLGLRLEKTGAAGPGNKKHPAPHRKDEETPERVDLINRIIERIKSV